ncbi:GNAT family N-acetyltransferase [Cohnella hashimotonis]|uniref:GNAT family N-acetyltransferase n=1 Tax=Cohnella hashimotonis TaxID=2826895 RepID=A0ABT6TNN3_9BACL|nr:GNAT family N-acetyltransferase [Cohnella hashimotonis]MDI4647442.1 GNAT family N-acetyltransferase [Cohnella hashimotonis]
MSHLKLPGTYAIRLVEQDDAELIFEYFGALSETTKSIFPGYPFTAEEASRLAREESNTSGIRRFIVIDWSPATSSERMAATLWFWDWGCMVPWIGLMVADEYQGKGLGKAMLEHSIQEARSSGKGGILLTTHKENVRGQALYARYGFQTIGRDERGEYLMILRF